MPARKPLTAVDEFGGERLTFLEAARCVERWSNGIAASIAPGDRVVLATPNSYEQFLLCLAVCSLNASEGKRPGSSNLLVSRLCMLFFGSFLLLFAGHASAPRSGPLRR